MFVLLARIRGFLAAYLQRPVNVWNEFWFKPLDPFALGLLRILSGGMLVYTHVVWGLELDAFFGPDGWQDELLVRVQQDGSPAISFWWYVPAQWLHPVHWICTAILVLYMLGAFTRLTSIAAFIILVSYANRAMNANFGLDQINALLTFYLMLGPSGRCLSFDSLYRRWRARNSSQPASSGCELLMSARLATRLIQVHMCLVYFFAGVSKLKGEAWWNGNAIWMAAANAEYQTGDLTWIAWYPWLGQMITHVTILWEIFFCVLVWNRGWRPIMLMIGTLMHLGIGAFLGMWTFGLVMIFTYISFIPPGLLRSIMRSIMLIVTDPFTRLSSRTPNDVTPSPPRENSSASAAPSASELHRAPSTEVLPPATLRQDLNCTGPDQLPFRNLTEITSFPSSILLVDSTTSRLARVQNFFLTEQLTCLAACDLSDASQQLVSRPFSGVILMADTYEELEEALQLRRLLIQMKQAGPVTVLAMTSAIAEVMLEPAEPDHRFVVEPFTPSDLLEELKAGWKSRGVSFDPTGTQQRKTVNQPATPLTAGQNEETMS